MLIEEGRNISFVLVGTEIWGKGEITKITSDSLFIEQAISKSDILTERESNYVVSPYALSSFRIMAYNNTPKAIGKSTIVILLVTLAVVGGGVELYNDDPKSLKVKKKFFKKNVDFDKGWKAKIVLCE